MTVPIRIFHFLVLLLVGPLASVADQSTTDMPPVLQPAQIRGLAQDPYWIALGHYLPANNRSGLSSEVTSTHFFLSSNGANDPQAELEATLRAIFLPVTDNPDQHAQCRFIARFHWLKKKLNLESYDLPKVHCAQFNKWAVNGQIESLSLIFATGFLDNPASFYGHLLLKFNTCRNVLANALLDQSINYGANVPPDENPLIYVFKGIFGGYDANFSDDQFYRHNHNYGENELRDLWEYELTLTDDEIQQIIHHSWELMDNTFTYFFLKENCAYRMAQLLELVIEQPLLPQDLPWSMPATVFDNLMRVERNGKPLVKDVRLIPSRQNRFYEKYFSLTKSLQHRLNDVVGESLDLKQASYQVLPATDKIAIVETLFDYYEFRMVQEEDDTEFQRAKHQLVVERASLPAGKTIVTDSSTPFSPPHQGPLPRLLRTELVHSSVWGTGLELQLRPVYYDSLSIDAGRLPNSHLTMFDLRALYRDEKLTLRSLDFVNVQTLNVSRTGMPGDGGRGWGLRVGLDNQDLSCDDCNVFRITAGVGKAISLPRNTVLFGMLEGLAQTSYHDSGTLGVNAKLGVSSSPWSAWTTQLSIGTRNYLNESKSHIRLVRWENRFGSSRDWDIRLRYEKQQASELSAGLSLYW